MAVYDIGTELNRINFAPGSVEEEVLQNVRFILATVKSSCPLDRDFAYDPGVDGPINLMQARLTSRLVTAIKRYEPRAQVEKISFQGDALEGKLKPVVKVRVEDDDAAV